MAKNITTMFKSRIGLATTGFILPVKTTYNNKQESVNLPYAYICLYDTKLNINKIIKLVNDNYESSSSKKTQSKKFQLKITLMCKDLFINYCRSLK
jgi:hypothetical protein